MRKNHFTCLVLSICLSFTVSAQTVTDIPAVISSGSYELKGDIRLLHERHFIYADEEPELAWDKQIHFDKSGRIETTKELKAGEKEQVIKRYRYNDAGKPLSEAYLNGSKEYDSIAYKYDHAGELDQKLVFDAGKRHQTTRYHYRNGRMSYIRVDGSNGLENMIRFRYDSDNGYKRTVLDNVLKHSYAELITDEKDAANTRRWSRYLYATPDSVSSQQTRIYDATGKLMEDITTGPDKKVQQYITNTYNEQGLPDKQEITTDVKRTTGYTYRFDNDGNWVERSKYGDGKVLETTTRVITYREAETKNAARTSGIKVIQQ